MLAAKGVWLTPAGAPDAVVRGVSFEVHSGEWLAITGRNGSGKTTLALAAAGLLAPGRGTMEWCGRPASERTLRKGCGPILAVLQDPGTQLLQPTVAEELRFTAANLGLPSGTIETETRRVSSSLGLDPDSRLDPHHLSAGGQQLVLIAAALIAGPGLLVADEPCAHVDHTVRRQVLDQVAERVRQGMAVVWVTQDPEEVARATRTLELAAAPLEDWSVEERGAEGEVALVLDVLEESRSAGPRIRTSAGLRLELRSPGLLALEGPNGSGKSVLLAAACGVAPVDQVRVERAGPAGSEAPPLLVSQYPEQMVFHDRVEDELLFAAVSRGIARPRARHSAGMLLQKLNLDPERLMSASVWDLSTGEKRLVELVAALIAPASLLALDEPTGGLDAGRRAVLARLVSERATRGAVLVASQDDAWVTRLGCRRWVFGNRSHPPSNGQKRD